MLVDESDLGPANSAWATLDNLAFIIGPAHRRNPAGHRRAGDRLPAQRALVRGRGGRPLAPSRSAGRRSERRQLDGRAGADAARAGASSSGRWPGRSSSTPSRASSLGGIGVLTVIIAVDVLERRRGRHRATSTRRPGSAASIAGIAGGALLARRLSVPLVLGGVVGGRRAGVAGADRRPRDGDAGHRRRGRRAAAPRRREHHAHPADRPRRAPRPRRRRAADDLGRSCTRWVRCWCRSSRRPRASRSCSSVRRSSPALGVAAALLLTARRRGAGARSTRRVPRLLEHPIFAGPAGAPPRGRRAGARAGPGHRRHRWWCGREIRRIGSTSFPRALSA